MTNLDISRRNMIALASAGVAGAALAGCKELGGNSEGGGKPGDGEVGVLTEAEVSNRVDGFIAKRGINNYGENPNGPPANSTVAFDPKYMVLIHLTSDGAWDIRSNHAHFSVPAGKNTPNLRTKWATAAFDYKINKKYRRFNKEPKNSKYEVFDINAAGQEPDYADYVEFEAFNFLSQHEIYIFYEHKSGAIRFDTVKNQLITFSEFHVSTLQANENHAFFNAKQITDTDLLGNLAGKGSLIRLENHYTVLDGNQLKLLSPQGSELPSNEAQNYKMNLLYVSGASGIVMVIDPSTGNGTGDRP